MIVGNTRLFQNNVSLQESIAENDALVMILSSVGKLIENSERGNKFNKQSAF